MKLHLLTKNTVQDFDATLPSNEDVVRVHTFNHSECACFDEAVNADIVAYAFHNGLVKIFFKDKTPRFLRVGVGIIGLKFSDDGTYLSILKQENGRVILHIVEIQNFFPVFTHVLLYSASDIKEYYLSNTTFYYIIQNEFTGTILHQIKFPYYNYALIPGVRVTSCIHFHDDSIFSFDPVSMCLKKYNEYHTNVVSHVSSALSSNPLHISSCYRNIWCLCDSYIYVFDVRTLELRASLNVNLQANIDTIVSYGNTCFCLTKKNTDDSIEFIKFTFDVTGTNEISRTLTRRFIVDDVSTILLRDSDFSYITSSSHPVLINHSGFLVLIPGIDYSNNIGTNIGNSGNSGNNNNSNINVQIEDGVEHYFLYPEDHEEDDADADADVEESEESDESEEEFTFANVLQQSLQNYQSKSGLQRVIDFIHSSMLHHKYWSNVQQFGLNEWSYIKSCIQKKKMYLFDLSIETHQRIIRDTEHIIDNVLKKERALFSKFFDVSETIGEFDGGLSTDLDHENFDADVIETTRVSSGEKKSFSEIDLLLSSYVPICNLTHANLLKTLFDEIDSNQEIMNCVTTGIIPTFNILIAQLQDFVLEIRIHINKLEKMRTWFHEQEEVEPKKKHARVSK